MAPLPKPAGQRVRRNKSQATWRQISADADLVAPELPGREPSWSESTCGWWATIWQSPMATAWLDADVPALFRLAALMELASQGELRVLGEIRNLEDRFGLSPKARRQLQWEVEQAAKPAEPVKLADVRRLRAVDAAG